MVTVGFLAIRYAFVGQIFPNERKAEQSPAFLVQLRSKMNALFGHQNRIDDMDHAIVSRDIRRFNHTFPDFDAHSGRVNF